MPKFAYEEGWNDQAEGNLQSSLSQEEHTSLFTDFLACLRSQTPPAPTAYLAKDLTLLSKEILKPKAQITIVKGIHQVSKEPHITFTLNGGYRQYHLHLTSVPVGNVSFKWVGAQFSILDSNTKYKYYWPDEVMITLPGNGWNGHRRSSISKANAPLIATGEAEKKKADELALAEELERQQEEAADQARRLEEDAKLKAKLANTSWSKPLTF